MSVKRILRSGLELVLSCLATKQSVYANVTTLGPNELLRGRVALVTGGTSGIGYAIAKAFVEAGATVIITGRDMLRLDRAVAQLKEDTSCCCIYGLRMNNLEITEFQAQFNEALRLVDAPIDILVNNAGVNGCRFGDGKEEDYDLIMNTNLKGSFFLSQIFAHYLKDNQIKGNILNVASSSSLRPAASAYTLSKWGIRGLTLGMARMLAPYGIVVNGIAPGPTATPMLMPEGVQDNIVMKNNLTGRYALPEEIASMSVVLVSNMSRMIIGDIVYMTGGAGLITNDDMNYNF